jgi:protein dithiol oxidoreductase (disulfide-forming)
MTIEKDLKMKRRDFSAVCGAALAASGLYAPALMAQQALPKKPEAGTDYYVLDKRASVEAPAGKIEVVEFFWYNCPHCNAFEPTLEAWVKNVAKDVSVRRVPVGFRDDFVPQQRLFYALEAMGLLEKLHVKVFTAIHGEKLQLNKSDVIADWLAKQGVDKAKFLEQYNSFSVSTKATKATQLQNSYKVEGVPALGIAGRYYTDGTLAKSMERGLLITDFLINVVRAGK